MPKFAKKSLSFLLRNDCPRQFRLSLYDDTERKNLPIPLRQQARAGSGNVGGAGDVYQAEQVAKVSTVFGTSSVVAAPPKPGKVRPEPLFLDTPVKQGEAYFDLATLQPYQFLVEARFELPTNFRRHFGLDGLKDEWNLPLSWARIQPDIILALPSRQSSSNACSTRITLDGSSVPLDANDSRIQLRIIDVKLAAEPGAHYFAEVVYYAMALAAWLEDKRLDDHFVVTTNPAIWPGSYAKSALSLRHEAAQRGLPATTSELVAAMAEDLEPAEISVYVPPLRRFFTSRLRQLLTTPWQYLEWHPNFRCQNCEFLGYPWPGVATDSEHCWIKAERDDALSRINGLSRGAAGVLRSVAPTVISLQSLAANHQIFREHPTLRAKSEIFRARANSLHNGAANAIAGSGGSATIPTFCDLKICVFLDYDAATSITAAISIVADWREPTYDVPQGHSRLTQKWGTRQTASFLNGSNSVGAEERQVLAFLTKLREILDRVGTLDAQRSERNHAETLKVDPTAVKVDLRSTYQLFLWDEAQFRHLRRIIERHFMAILANSALRTLAWLFPPDDVMPHPDLASRQSPISFLAPAVEHHVAAPVPHHYTLLRAYPNRY